MCGPRSELWPNPRRGPSEARGPWKEAERSGRTRPPGGTAAWRTADAQFKAEPGTHRPPASPAHSLGPRGGGVQGRPPTQAPLPGARGLQLDGAQDHVHLVLVGAHVPPGPHRAASAAAGGGVLGPAHDHLTVQVHGREAVQEVEGAEFEADDVGRWLLEGPVGVVLHTPARRGQSAVRRTPARRGLCSSSGPPPAALPPPSEPGAPTSPGSRVRGSFWKQQVSPGPPH